MSAGSLPREYRISRGRATGIVVAVSFACLPGVLALWVTDDFSAAVKWSVVLPLLALLAWLVTASTRASTSADLKGIRIRGFFGTRRLSWSQIQDRRVEINPGAMVQENASQPNFVSYPYRDDGKRLQLMYLDDATVNLEREVALLRAAWEELRGEDWTRSADISRRIARGEARRLAAMAGFGWAMLSFLPLIALMLLPLFVDLPDALDTSWWPFLVLGTGLPAAFALGMTLSYRKHLRLLPDE